MGVRAQRRCTLSRNRPASPAGTWLHASGGRARPFAADGDVQEQEERIIERPRRARRQARFSDDAVQELVHVETDDARFPFDCELVKVVCEALTLRERIGRGDMREIALLGVSGPMDRSVNDAWLAADVFHDVDLAAERPPDFAEVVAEHPEGRPEPRAGREFDPRLDAAIRCGITMLCVSRADVYIRVTPSGPV